MAIKSPAASDRSASAPAAVVGFDAFLAKLGTRDRLNIERHVAACEAEPSPEHHRLWHDLVTSLFALAPHSVQTVGQQAVQFYIPDGKYRMQVFALEDQRDGKILLYTADVLAQALRQGIVSRPRRANPPSSAFVINADPDQTILIDALDAANTPNPSVWYKHMLGWNRKALRITLLSTATPEQLRAAVEIAALSAKQWPARAPEA